MLKKYFSKTKSECPDVRIRLPEHKFPKSWEYLEDPVVPFERNLYGHPLAGLLWERQFEKASVYVDDIKMAGKKQNLARMWRKLMKNVDIEERTSLLDHVYLGCT